MNTNTEGQKKKVVIFDGQQDELTPKFEKYLNEIQQKFEVDGYSVSKHKIREINLQNCLGCLNCWVKTPGICKVKDEGDILRKAWVNADLLILASPLMAGFATSLLKKAIDNFLPLTLPYFHIVDKELRHYHRHSFPPMACIFEPSTRDTTKDLQINYDWVKRIAYHIDQEVIFETSIDQKAEKLVEKTNSFFNGECKTEKTLVWKKPIKFPVLEKKIITNIVIFNGSLRVKSNTKILIEHIKKGFESTNGNSVKVCKLNNKKNIEIALNAWQNADLVLFATPMYVHAMPAQLKFFLEKIDKLQNTKQRRIGFLIQYGFLGAHQGRWLEEYFSQLASRWNAEYMGSIVRGGVEGIQRKTDKQNNTLFTNIEELGFELGRNAILSQKISDKISKTEYLSMPIRFVFSTLRKIGLADRFWNKQLKENNAFENRLAKSY